MKGDWTRIPPLENRCVTNIDTMRGYLFFSFFIFNFNIKFFLWRPNEANLFLVLVDFFKKNLAKENPKKIVKISSLFYVGMPNLPRFCKNIFGMNEFSFNLCNHGSLRFYFFLEILKKCKEKSRIEIEKVKNLDYTKIIQMRSGRSRREQKAHQGWHLSLSLKSPSLFVGI